VFHLGDSERVIIRPSGTEPKTKIYVEVIGDPVHDDSPDALAAAQRAVEQRAHQIEVSITDIALTAVGISLPSYAFRMSPLVAVEHRVDFCQAFLPELVSRIHSGEPVAAWTEQRLGSYGKDARQLVQGAVVAYADTLRADDAELADQVAASFAG